MYAEDDKLPAVFVLKARAFIHIFNIVIKRFGNFKFA
jgi:hypothetical protein